MTVTTANWKGHHGVPFTAAPYSILLPLLVNLDCILFTCRFCQVVKGIHHILMKKIYRETKLIPNIFFFTSRLFSHSTLVHLKSVCANFSLYGIRSLLELTFNMAHTLLGGEGGRDTHHHLSAGS